MQKWIFKTSFKHDRIIKVKGVGTMKKKWWRWIILGFIFFPIIREVVFPYAMIALIIYSLSEKDKKKKTTKRKSKKTTPVIKKMKLLNHEAEKINQRLTIFFKEDEKLPITDTIFLMTQKGVYTSVDELYITFQEDCVATLEEFGNHYPAMYNDILSMLIKFSQTEIEKQPESEAEEGQVEKESLSDTLEFIEKINQLNNEIDNEQITSGLNQTCALLKHISILEKKFPESQDKLTKLKQYYLPILLDILENYKQLNPSAHDHEEFKKSEERLIKTIILINEAIKTITVDMHEDDFINLSADISTLEALLKKDGLVKEGTMEAMRMKVGDGNE